MNPRTIYIFLALATPCPSLSVASQPTPAPTGPRPVLTLKGHAFAIESIAFNPDGRLLASASKGLDNADTAGEVKVWDLKTGGELLSLRGHKYGVWKIAFSPDGKRLASAGVDEAVKIWDV